MYVVGGHGYVGSRVVALAGAQGAESTVVSVRGDERFGVSSIAWPAFLAELESHLPRHLSIVWLLDGAKHGELDRLTEILGLLDERFHITAVSTCTVIGEEVSATRGRPSKSSPTMRS